MKAPNRFIVVDDDPTNNFLCQYTIRKFSEGADIKLFTEPEEALGFIQEEYGKGGEDSPTLLFLDINMPSMTGWEFLDQFKDFDDKIIKQFTIYILSSSVDERDKARAQSNELVSGFLSKPLKVENVRQIIEKDTPMVQSIG